MARLMSISGLSLNLKERESPLDSDSDSLDEYGEFGAYDDVVNSDDDDDVCSICCRSNDYNFFNHYESDDDDDMVEGHSNPLIEVDGFILKISDPQFYASFLTFQYFCRLLCGLESSRNPRDVGEELDQKDEFYSDLAVRAIENYNQHRKKPKLKFEQLVKVNRCCEGCTYNLTFLASNGENDKIGTYRATLLQHEEQYFLGLFVDHDSQEVLLIVSLTGAAARADMLSLRKIIRDGNRSKRE